MLNITKCRYTPPRSPQNIFFPWHTVAIQRTGSFIASNRIILNVPVNLTTYEIRNYLTQIYGAKIIEVHTLVRLAKIKRVGTGRLKGKYYRDGPMRKRAYITTEFAVPNEVKMLSSTTSIRENPDILKRNVSWGCVGRTKQSDKKLPIKRGAWTHTIPKLLAPNTMELNPKFNNNYTEVMLPPDLSKPFRHDLAPFSPPAQKVAGTPEQPYAPIDLRPWRKRVKEIQESGTLSPAGASAGLPGAVPSHPLLGLLKKPLTHNEKIPVVSSKLGLLRAHPTPWKRSY